MAQLNVRLDDRSRDLLDALARARGFSTSDLIRSLIDKALGLDDPDRRADTSPRSLSAVERRGFALQHEILALLTAEDGEEEGDSAYHRRMVEVLTNGYATEYPDMFLNIQPEMTERECTLVSDILEMFTVLEATFEKLTEDECAGLGEHADYALSFRGFDLNDSTESRLHSFASYLIRNRRWEPMAKHFDTSNDSGNSHMPMLASYQRMLSVWKPMRDQKAANWRGPDSFRLTTDELRKIVAEWPYSKS